MLKEPYSIRVQTGENDWISLTNNQDGYWSSMGITIELIENVRGEKASLFLKADYLALKRVQITWKQMFSKETLFFEDAFERGYGDLGYHLIDSDKKMPWYFVTKDSDDSQTGWGVMTDTNSLCEWQVTSESVDLWLDIRSGTQAIRLDGRKLACGTICHISGMGDSFSFVRTFCKKLAAVKPKKMPPVFGGNDWYSAYGNNSEELIMSMTHFIHETTSELPIAPYMVIDDGWQKGRKNWYNGGPWNQSNDKFPSMSNLANEIKQLGVKPGIWFRPLQFQLQDNFSKEMILRYEDDNTVILDPSHPAVLKHVATDVKRFGEWGYQLIKHDFSTYDIFGQWGFEMVDDYFKFETSFFDKTKTTAEILHQFYSAIRAATGDMMIIGCNTVGHLSVGKFELHRTGDDTSGREFSRTRKMGVNTLAFRMPQHDVFYGCDADCVGITNMIPWEVNREWFRLLAYSGTPLFISFDLKAVTTEIKEDIQAGFEIAAMNQHLAKPLNWEFSKIPETWITDTGMQKFHWYQFPRVYDGKEIGKE